MSGGFDLRGYQREAIQRINTEIAAGRRRIILVMQTGAGKTRTAAAFCAPAIEQGQRVLWLTHRRELVGQASRTLYRGGGIDAGVILPGFPMRLGEAMQIASIASLLARAMRSSTIDLPDADIVVVDECHHAPARSWRRLLAAYPNAIILGLSATPARGDGRGLGGLFDIMVEGPSVAELIRLDHLVPSRFYAPSQPDLSGVRVERGDYVEAQLAERMDKPQLVGDVVSHWLRLAERRRTIVFATGVAHSAHLRDEFRRAGVVAEHLDGSTPVEERDAILAGLAAGRVEVACNCAVLGEGFDAPDVGCLILARPTKSLPLYRQMVGRGLRSATGKRDCLILDHSGNVFRHGFPEDDIEWTLDPDRRAENKAHRIRSSGNMPRLVDCPECHAVRFQGQPCPACGWRPRPKPNAVDIIEGDLGEVDRSRQVRGANFTAADKQRFQRQLAWIARERGYRDGWVAHKYRERFGAWPQRRFVEPLAPDEATRSWVRSRGIAWARAQQKAGAA